MRKKGLILIIFFITSFGLMISDNIKVNGELNIGRLKVDDSFTWDVVYNNTYEPALNFLGQITHTIEQINDDNLSIRLLYGTSSLSFFVEPQNALDYLPMGAQVDILHQPSIDEIILPLSIITTDWEEQRDKWYFRDILNTFTEVSWIWIRNYTYGGALRDFHIFGAKSVNYNFNEPTALNFNITYTTKNGFMFGYEFKLIGQDSGDTIDLSISLVSSTKVIGWSYSMKIIMTFTPTYGAITLVGGVTIGATYFKKRIEKIEEETEEEIDDVNDDEEIDEFEKIIKEEVTDYNFIRICSFCKAEVPEESDICPECGGKK